MQFILSSHQKYLHVFTVNLNGPEHDIGNLKALIEPIFQELSPFLKLDQQVLFMRDNKQFAIEKRYPGGNTYVANETQIAVAEWPVDQKLLIATIAHELHHMARWQNAGYGVTLGQAIISEGLAGWYEELKSGWKPPWVLEPVAPEVLKEARREWNNEHYNHGEWFFNGPHGKWAGYAIGHKLIKKSKAFTLEDSLGDSKFADHLRPS